MTELIFLAALLLSCGAGAVWILYSARNHLRRARALKRRTSGILGAISKKDRFDLYQRAAQTEEACGSLVRPVFDVRWDNGPIECMFGAEDYEPDLAARQDEVCSSGSVTVVAHVGTCQPPPHYVHLYMHPIGGAHVWAGVMTRSDRQLTVYEIAAALVEWRIRRGHKPPLFSVRWWTEDEDKR